MAIKEEFGLSLFGFDVIVPVRTVTYSSAAQMGIGTRTGILESGSRSFNHHHSGFAMNGITSDTSGTCQLKTMGMGMGVTLNGSSSDMIDEEYIEKVSLNSTNKILEKNGEKEGEEKEYVKTEEVKENETEGQGQGEGQEEGQGCQHLHTVNRIESNRTSSKIHRHPTYLESNVPSDPRSASMIHSAFPNKGIQDIQNIQQSSQVTCDKNAYLSSDKVIINSENKEEIRINEEKDEGDFGKDKEKDKNEDKTDDKIEELKREVEEKEEKGEEKVEEDASELVVIDVNYFPSYKEVPDFPQRLRKFLRQKAGMALYSTVQN